MGKETTDNGDHPQHLIQQRTSHNQLRNNAVQLCRTMGSRSFPHVSDAVLSGCHHQVFHELRSVACGASLLGASLACYDFAMPHTTPAGERAYAVVNHWMSNHSEVSGLWDVFEGCKSFDIIVSVGHLRLTLIDEQGAPTLKPEVEERILNWLSDLARQPTTAQP